MMSGAKEVLKTLCSALGQRTENPFMSRVQVLENRYTSVRANASLVPRCVAGNKNSFLDEEAEGKKGQRLARNGVLQR